MFIKDFRREFYDVIARQHIVVIANVDVDAVCAFKILQFLFRCDHVSYTLVPVAALSDFRRAIGEHVSQVKFVFLLNCGATMSLSELSESLPETVFFILDSRRPFNVDSVYDGDRIKLLINETEENELHIPAYEDIYDDDEGETSDNDDDDDDAESGDRGEHSGYGSDEDLFASPKKKRQRSRRLIKDSRKCEERRRRIMFDYEEFSYYSYSSAVLLYDLAWKLSKDNSDLLWWACSGLTSQFLERKMNPATYVIRAMDLAKHITRLNRSAQEEANEHLDRLKLACENDLLLSLYRRWSLFESLRHTASTACYFKSWTFGGECKLQSFLADLGLPLTQCRQRYSAMDSTLRQEVHKAIDDKLEKYGLKELKYTAFSARYSFGHKVLASDTAEAIAAVLNFGGGNTLESNFLTALDCLSKSQCALLYDCMRQCKSFLKTLWSDVKVLLNSGHVVPQHSFLLAQLSVGTPGWCYFSKPFGLLALGHCLLRAFVSQKSGQKHRDKPMLVMIPRPSEDGGNWLLVAGVPPIFTLSDGERPQNCLGQLFNRISREIRCRIEFDYFDNAGGVYAGMACNMEHMRLNNQ